MFSPRRVGQPSHLDMVMEEKDEPWVEPEDEKPIQQNSGKKSGAWAVVLPASSLNKPLLFSSLAASLSIYRPTPTYGSTDNKKPNTYKNLQEGDVFLKDEILYKIRPTASDGACALHALLGKENGRGIWQCGEDSSAVRSLYVQQFIERGEQYKEKITRLLVDFLKDYQGKKPSTYARMIFENLPQEELLSREQWVQKERVVQAYLTACARKDYWFSVQEIRLAAHLFNKRVKIFYLINGKVECEEDGPEEGEEVFIFHRGNHFCRCTALPSRTYTFRGSLDPSVIMGDHFSRDADSPPPRSFSTVEKFRLRSQITAKKMQTLCVRGSVGVVALGAGIGIGAVWGSRIDDFTEACVDYLNSTLPRVFECEHYEENERTLKVIYPIVALMTIATSGYVFQMMRGEFQKLKPRPLQERSVQKIKGPFSDLLKWFFGVWLYRGLWGDQHDPESWNAYYKCQEAAICLISFELGRNIHNREAHGKKSIRSLQKYKNKISTALHRFPHALNQIEESLQGLLKEGCTPSTRLLLTNLIRSIQNQEVPGDLFAPQEKLSRLLEVLSLTQGIVKQLLSEDSKEAFLTENREELRLKLNELDISLDCSHKAVEALIGIYKKRKDPLSTLSSNLLLVAVSSIASIAFLGFDVEAITKELFIALGTRPWGQLSVDSLQKRKSSFLSIRANQTLKQSYPLLTFVPFYFYARNFSSLQMRGAMMASIGWLSGVKEAFHEKLSYPSKNEDKKKNMLEIAWIISCIGSGTLLLTTGWPKCYHSNLHNCAVALGVEEQWINLDGIGCGATLITAGVTHLARKTLRFLGGYYSKFNNLVEWMDRWSFELRLLAPYFGFNSAKHLEEYDAYVSYNPLGFAVSLGLATGIYTDQAFNALHPEEGEAGEYSDVLEGFMEAFAK